MADDAAVLDAPVTETTATDTATTDVSDASQGQNVADGTTNANSDQIDNADTPQPGETGHLFGSELYRAIKDRLKTAGFSGKEMRSIRNAIGVAAEAHRISGGDPASLAQMQETYGRLALQGEENQSPEQLVESALADRQQLAGIIADLDAGGEKMLTELIEDRPETFQSLLPNALDKWSQMDNAGFSAYVSQAAVGWLDSQNIPVQLAILDTFLPQSSQDPGTQRVIDAVNAIKQALNGFRTMAQGSGKRENGTKPARTGTTPDNREQELTEREMNITRAEWNQTAARANMNLYNSELSRLATDRKITLTDAEKSKIQAAVREEFDSRLGANRNYGQTMQDYIRNGNRREYERRAASEGQKLLPSIISRHFEATIAARTAAKTNGAARPAVNGQQNSAQPAKDGNGNLIQWLSGPPRSLGKQVDLNRTTHAMLARHEAYIVGEKPLFKWKERVN